jgi:hypothetical protein
MPKKQFNLDSLTNELEQSAFFPSRQSPPGAPEVTPKAVVTAQISKGNHASTETRKRGNTESGSSSSQSPTPPLFHFNPGTKADQKYTLAFTEEELEIIEDIKLDLRRRFGIKTSKN